MNTRAARWMIVLAAGAAGAVVLPAGCGGDARVELAAVEAMQSLATAMDLAIDEYHNEVTHQDDGREAAVVAAFLERIQRDAGDEAAWDNHATDFQRALQRLRADRALEWQRYYAARDNVALLRETGEGLQRLAVASLTLEDETRRYVLSLIDAVRRKPAP